MKFLSILGSLLAVIAAALIPMEHAEGRGVAVLTTPLPGGDDCGCLGEFPDGGVTQYFQCCDLLVTGPTTTYGECTDTPWCEKLTECTVIADVQTIGCSYSDHWADEYWYSLCGESSRRWYDCPDGPANAWSIQYDCLECEGY